MDALSVGIVRKKVNYVLDADISDFFARLDQAWLEKFLEHRIADRRVLRLIQKWLSAGVIEDGEWSEHGGGNGARGRVRGEPPVPRLRAVVCSPLPSEPDVPIPEHPALHRTCGGRS